jgi:hypothetical protein
VLEFASGNSLYKQKRPFSALTSARYISEVWSEWWPNSLPNIEKRETEKLSKQKFAPQRLPPMLWENQKFSTW